MGPNISVIIPVYNAAAFLADALVSVRAAMGDMPYEIIVVNDGSTDNMEDALGQWMEKIIYTTQPNKGAAAARNAGLQKARGQYVAFLDADDVWDRDHVTLLLNEYVKNPDLEIAMGYIQRFRSIESPARHNFYGGEELLPSFESALIRASTFEKVGVLNDEYRLHEDVDWFLRAIEADVVIAKVPHVVSYYRIHNLNTTHNLKPGDASLLYVLSASLKRRSAKKILSLKNSAL